jgi:hypothetical protein
MERVGRNYTFLCLREGISCYSLLQGHKSEVPMAGFLELAGLFA